MQLDVYTEIDPIYQAHRKIQALRSEDVYNQESDLIVDFLRFLGNASSCLFFSEKEKESKMDQILAFLRMISDNKPRDLVRFENRFFNKLDRSEDLRNVIKGKHSIAFLNRDTSRITDLGMKSQVLLMNIETLNEKWKKLAHQDELRFPKVIAINNQCGFSWEKLNPYKEVTSKIIICDRQLFNIDKKDYLDNIVPLIHALIPDITSYNSNLRIILIGARNGSGPTENYIKKWGNHTEVLEFLKSEFKNYPNVNFTVAALDHKKVHDRLVFTDYFSFDIGHCFDILNTVNTVKPNINTTLKINGIGGIANYREINKQYQQQKTWFNEDLNKDSTNFYGVKKELI